MNASTEIGMLAFHIHSLAGRECVLKATSEMLLSFHENTKNPFLRNGNFIKHFICFTVRMEKFDSNSTRPSNICYTYVSHIMHTRRLSASMCVLCVPRRFD